MTPREEQQLRESLGLPIESDDAANVADVVADGGNASARREHAQLVRLYETFDREHETHMRELLAMLPEGAPPQAVTNASGLGRLGGFVVQSIRKHKIAAVLMPAACLMIVAFFAINTTSQTAFARAVQRLRAFTAATCDARFETRAMDGSLIGLVSTGRLILTENHGSRQDLFAEDDVRGTNIATVTLMPPDGTVVTINAATKTFMRLTPNEQFRGVPVSLLQTWLDLLKQTENPDRELGVRTIGGRRCAGFEVGGKAIGMPVDANHAPMPLRVWVDLEANVLAELEMRLPMPDGAMMVATYSRFDWDAEIDLAELSPDVPDDYQTIENTTPESNESTLLAALRDYAAVVGEYPTTTVPATAAGTFVGKLIESGTLGDLGERKAQEELNQRALLVGAGLGYFQTLQLNERDLEYSGSAVKPGDAAAILASWNADGGERRVVYGDLRVATIDSPN